MLSEPRVTIKQLAQDTGFSVCTINKALNNKPRVSPATRELVIKSAARLGYRPNALARALARPKLTIGFVHPNVWPAYTGLMIQGVMENLARLNDHRVNPIVSSIPARDENAFLSVIRNLADQKVSGLILCLDYYTSACLDKAWRVLRNAAIPFVLLGNDIPCGPQLCSVWHDCRRCGSMAAEMLELMVPGSSVATFIGRQGVLDHDLKMDGFRHWMKKSELNLLETCETHDDPGKGYPVARDLFERHPDIAGIYVATENIAGICRYLLKSKLTGKVKVVATGMSAEVRHGLARGIVHCSINQNERLQGQQAARILYDYLENGRKPQSPEILVVPQLILRSTADVETWCSNNDFA